MQLKEDKITAIRKVSCKIDKIQNMLGLEKGLWTVNLCLIFQDFNLSLCSFDLPRWSSKCAWFLNFRLQSKHILIFALSLLIILFIFFNKAIFSSFSCSSFYLSSCSYCSLLFYSLSFSSKYSFSFRWRGWVRELNVMPHSGMSVGIPERVVGRKCIGPPPVTVLPPMFLLNLAFLGMKFSPSYWSEESSTLNTFNMKII